MKVGRYIFSLNIHKQSLCICLFCYSHGMLEVLLRITSNRNAMSFVKFIVVSEANQLQFST